MEKFFDIRITKLMACITFRLYNITLELFQINFQ